MAVSLRRILPNEVKALALDPIDEKTRGQAADILKQVVDGGEAKLLEIAVKFGDIKQGKLPSIGEKNLEYGSTSSGLD
jgi:hypothetical protein